MVTQGLELEGPDFIYGLRVWDWGEFVVLLFEGSFCICSVVCPKSLARNIKAPVGACETET